MQAWWDGDPDSWSQTFRDGNCNADWDLPKGIRKVSFYYRECPACAEKEHALDSWEEMKLDNWDRVDFCIKASWANYYGRVTYSLKGGHCTGD